MVIAPPVASRNELSGPPKVTYAANMACTLHGGRLNHVVRVHRAPVKIVEGVIAPYAEQYCRLEADWRNTWGRREQSLA